MKKRKKRNWKTFRSWKILKELLLSNRKWSEIDLNWRLFEKVLSKIFKIFSKDKQSHILFLASKLKHLLFKESLSYWIPFLINCIKMEGSLWIQTMSKVESSILWANLIDSSKKEKIACDQACIFTLMISS